MKTEDCEEGLKELIKVYNSIIEYQRRGSTRTMDKVLDVTLYMVRY